MITNVTIDLDKVRQDRNRFFAHIGHIVVTCAAIDQRLVELAVALDIPTVPDRYSQRTTAVRRALAEWPDADLLQSRLKEAGEYRDDLVHSAYATRMSVLTGEVRHGGIREKNARQFKQHDLDRIPEQEARAEVLDFAVFAVVQKVESGRLDEWLLRALTIDFFTSPDAEVTAAIDYLFPA